MSPRRGIFYVAIRHVCFKMVYKKSEIVYKKRISE